MLGAGPWSRGSCVCWEGYVSHGYWEAFAPSAGHAGGILGQDGGLLDGDALDVCSKRSPEATLPFRFPRI